jgi:hypothetical protein
MIPRELGAYGQLLFPLTTALAIGRPGWGAMLFALAGTAAFLAHEPLLVLLGQRGGRAVRDRGGAAAAWLAAWAGVAAVCAVAAFVLMPPAARVAVVVPASLVLVASGFILVGRERTAAGEVASATTLASLGLPAGLAAGAPLGDALTCTIVFVAVFIVATLSVRAVMAGSRGPDAVKVRVVACFSALGAIGLLTVLAQTGVVSPAGAWAALPVCAVGLWLVTAMPSPQRLRTIGWTVSGAMAAGAAILVAVLRG